MRKLVVGAFLTLDGVVQASGGPNEDRDGGFLHGGQLVPYFDDRFAAIMAKWTTQARLFGEGTIPRAFRLVETQETATGAVLHVYDRAGVIKCGKVEVGEERVIFDSDTAHN